MQLLIKKGMSTKRSLNKVVENQGIRYVKGIVQDGNCIFQGIDLENDQGNDCYIEFISENVATSFCIFAQIKSGKSYKDNIGYKIPTDKEHLEYWKNGVHPIVGIVYDQERKEAFWGNITKYIENNPQILKQKAHDIRISKDNSFSQSSFDTFKNHFINCIHEYKSNENFAKSLILFSEVEKPENCYEGLKSLFSNHRDKKSAWFYIVTNFGKIKEPGIHYNILGMLSNYTNNPHIFWHRENMKYFPNDETISKYIKTLIDQYFGEIETKIAITFTKGGVVKGGFSFLVFLVLSLKENIHVPLEQIIKAECNIDQKNNYFWLYIHFLQRYDVNKAIEEIDKYLKSETGEDYLFEGMKETLLQGGYLPIG